MKTSITTGHQTVERAALSPRVAFFCRAVFLFAVMGSKAWASDVGPAVENLGSPFQKGAYARNVWDLQFFGGRLYLSHGDTSNGGPTPNAGPIPIVSLNTATGQFIEEFVADDEQLKFFRVVNGQLCVPGLDPREDWSFGNFYRLEGTGWRKYRNIPAHVHDFDLYEYKGQMLAAGSGNYEPSVTISKDWGQTWTGLSAAPGGARFYTFFELNGILHLPELGTPTTSPLWNEYDGSRTTRRSDLTFAAVFPGAVRPYSSGTGRITSPVNFLGAVVYIGEAVPDNGWTVKGDVVGAFVARSLAKTSMDVRKIVLPAAADVPWDLLARADAIYLLASEKVEGSPDAFIIKVYRTTDLNTWTELFRFTRPTFARSFEEMSGDFYLGLGTDYGTAYITPSYTDDIRNESGTLLRVKKAAYAPEGNPAPGSPRNLRKK